MGPTTAKIFSLLSSLVCLAAFGAHIVSLLPSSTISMDQAWPIHLAIFVPFYGMIWASRGTQPKIETPSTGGWWEKRRQQNQLAKEQLRNLLKRCPRWVYLFTIVLIAYVFINFFTFISEMRQGSPTKKDGRFYTSNHGKIVHEIDEQEYRRLQAYEVRGFSGHWMLFAFIPFAYFRYFHRYDNDVSRGFDSIAFSDDET